MLDAEKRRQEAMEAKWKGRAGGLDIAAGNTQRARSEPSSEDKALASSLPPLSQGKGGTGNIQSSQSMAALTGKRK